MVIQKTGLEYERPYGFNHDFEPGSQKHIHFILNQGEENAHWKVGVPYHAVWMLGQYIQLLEEMFGLTTVQSTEPWETMAKIVEKCGKEGNNGISDVSGHGIWLFKRYIEMLEELLEEKAA